MRIVFWLLDINYEAREQRPEIWLWGIDDKQQRILIIDRNFLTYFYLVVKEGQSPESIIRNIESQKTSDFPSIAKLEPVKRKYFGKSVSAVKVYCQDPDVVTRYAKAMTKIDGVKESLEDDIRYSMLYLIDKGISPCCWHEVEVDQTRNTSGVHVNQAYVARAFPKSIEKTELPQLRVLSFSTIAYSQKGVPKPEKDPLVIVSVATNTGEEAQFIEVR
jgi:DNA polymerase I